MKEVTTLENDSDKSKDQFENFEVNVVQLTRPPLRKIDSHITN
jgi:hypothetical protein